MVCQYSALHSAIDVRSIPCRENGQSYYPPYLVIATSVMGVILARYLKQQRLIQWGAYHFMCCLNIGKVFMLVMPEARMGLPVAMLLLVGAPPLTVPLRDGYFDLSRDGGFPDPSRKIGPAETSPMGTARKKVIKTMAAVVLFGFQVMHVGFVRLAVFDAVAAVWGGPPPEGVLLCALLVTAAATFSPLVYTWYPNSTVRFISSHALLAVLLHTSVSFERHEDINMPPA